MEGGHPHVAVVAVVAFGLLVLPRVAPVAVCVPIVLVGVLLPCGCPSVGQSSFADVRLDAVRTRAPRAALVAWALPLLFRIGTGVRLKYFRNRASKAALASWAFPVCFGPGAGVRLNYS